MNKYDDVPGISTPDTEFFDIPFMELIGPQGEAGMGYE